MIPGRGRRWTLIAAAAGCVAVAALPRAARAGSFTPVPPSPVISRILSLPPSRLPSGIAAGRQGTLYVSLLRQGQILRIAPDGTRSVLATLPAGTEALGLRVDPAGDVYVAAAGAGGGVWRIPAAGGPPARLAALAGFPAGLAFGGGGDLYVSDPVSGVIDRLDRGGRLTPWSGSPLLAGTAGNGPCGSRSPGGLPLGVSGLAVAGNGDVLAANLTRGMIIRIPVRPDGSAGAAQVAAGPDCRLWGAAGLALDGRGTLYAAAATAGDIVRVSPQGRLQAVAARAAGDPLATPAGLAFGPGWRDRSQLYVTNTALLQGGNGAGVVMLSLGVPGWPWP